MPTITYAPGDSFSFNTNGAAAYGIAIDDKHAVLLTKKTAESKYEVNRGEIPIETRPCYATDETKFNVDVQLVLAAVRCALNVSPEKSFLAGQPQN